MPDMNVKINAHSENPTKTVVEARNFKIIIDEPKNLGGTNDGGTPIEYLLASLSGCLTVVGHAVAKDLNMNLNGMKIEIDGKLNPARFMGKSKDERAGYKALNVKIIPDTDADENMLNKWLEEVEDRCPVTDNILNATPINISL